MRSTHAGLIGPLAACDWGAPPPDGAQRSFSLKLTGIETSDPIISSVPSCFWLCAQIDILDIGMKKLSGTQREPHMFCAGSLDQMRMRRSTAEAAAMERLATEWLRLLPCLLPAAAHPAASPALIVALFQVQAAPHADGIRWILPSFWEYHASQQQFRHAPGANFACLKCPALE